MIPKRIESYTASAKINIIGLGQFPNDEIPQEWSREILTIAEAEKRHGLTIKELGPDPVPFGYLNPQWQEFKNFIRPGDELWKVSFSDSPLSGATGLCILRDNKVVLSFLISMN